MDGGAAPSRGCHTPSRGAAQGAAGTHPATGRRPEMICPQPISEYNVPMDRRSFLRTAGVGAVSLTNFPYHLFAAGKKKLASDRVKLGPRKIELSRLAMGTGTSGGRGSSNQTRKLG